MGKKVKKILFVVGPSGGHFFPAFRFALYAKRKNLPFQPLFCGELPSSLVKILDKEDFSFFPLCFYPPSKSYPLFLISFLKNFLKFSSYLLKEKPALLVSSGGYPSLGACTIGRILGFLIAIYEPNIVPGKANLYLGRFAKIVLTGFPETTLFFSSHHAVSIGVPVGEIYPREGEALLVVGGSQGSLFFNKKIPWLVKNFPGRIIHLCGKQEINGIRKIYGEKGEVLTHFFPMDKLYSKVKVCISRGGAITLSELAARGIPTLVVPLLTTYTSHQRDNAYYFQKRFNFLVAEEKEVKGKIQTFLNSPLEVKLKKWKGVEEKFWKIIQSLLN